jgi:phosphohistidine phosphatase
VDQGAIVIYLVHHADAVGPEVEPQRPLSPSGRAHAEALAQQAAARCVRPAAIWHSGKLRARQTAEPFHRLCNPLAEFSAIRGLQPEDPPMWVQDVLTGEARDVLLVGHLPSLPRLLTVLVRGDEREPLSFPLHGLVALEAAGARWREAFRL